MARVIDVTSGAAEYVGGVITELTGEDISGDTVKVALGGLDAPTAWLDPDVREGTGATATVKLLVGSSTAPGTYYLWVRVSDNPEVVPLRVTKPIVVK